MEPAEEYFEMSSASIDNIEDEDLSEEADEECNESESSCVVGSNDYQRFSGRSRKKTNFFGVGQPQKDPLRQVSGESSSSGAKRTPVQYRKAMETAVSGGQRSPMQYNFYRKKGIVSVPGLNTKPRVSEWL